MDHAAFQYLVRSSEQDAEDHPDAYRRKVLAFAMLGLLYVLFTLVLGAALLWWSAHLFGSGKRFYAAAVMGISGLSLLWLALRSLYVHTPLPEGFPVTHEMAPELFHKLDKLQKRLKAPPIHRVIVTDDYNAFIHQHLRWGFFGKTTNTLGLGLPLVLSLDGNRLLSVLAHEYAHLRGQDGKASARLYRIHHAWSRLAAYTDSKDNDDADLYTWLTTAFLRWYTPRFLARSFAVARQEEYLADAWSARICGKATTSAALIEIALLAPHVQREHWKQYWQLAHDHISPPVMPYAWLADRQLRPPAHHALQEGLFRLQREQATFDDTHPRTFERVEALKQPFEIPLPSVQHAGKMLGPALSAAIVHLDQQWWERQRTTWNIVHQQARQWRAEAGELQARQDLLQIPQLERLAQLLQRTHQGAAADAVFARIRQLQPDNVSALWQHIVQLVQRADPAALPLLEQLAAQNPRYASRACELALDVLDRLPYDEAHSAQRKRWAEKQQDCLQLEEEYISELRESSLLAQTGPHNLSTPEVQDLISSAQRMGGIDKLWLLRKGSRVMPWRNYYIAVIQPASGKAGEALSMQEAEQTLDVPGHLVCIQQDWMSEMVGSEQPPTLGDAVFDKMQHRLKI